MTNCLYYSKLSKLNYLFCTFSVNFPISLFALPLVQWDKTVILDQLNKSEGWALNSRFLCYLAGRYVCILFRLSRYSQVFVWIICSSILAALPKKNSILIIYHTVKKEKIMVHSCVFGLIFTGIVFFVILPWGAVNLILSWSCVIVNDSFFFVKPDPMVCSPNVLQIHIIIKHPLLCSLSFKDWLRYLKSHSRIWYR